MKQLEANGEKKILPAFLYGPELTSPTSKLALYSSVTVIVEESVIFFFSIYFCIYSVTLFITKAHVFIILPCNAIIIIII